MKYANGDDYEGCWVSDARHGEGTMKYASGDAYTGTWKHGMYDVGERTFTETDDCYSGAWEADLPHGRGTMVYGRERGVMKPGDVYEGPWAAGDAGLRDVFGHALALVDALKIDVEIVIFDQIAVGVAVLADDSIAKDEAMLVIDIDNVVHLDDL